VKASVPARTLVLWCPDWPVSAGGRRPEEAVAVVADGKVVAASAAARRSGVRPPQRRRQAESRCPGLAVVPRDPGAEVRAFEPVVVALERFGAPVAVRRPGWAALATRGPARYFGGEESFAVDVAGAVEALGESLGLAGERRPVARRAPLVGDWWRVGIADGPFAATMAAQQGRIVPRGGARAFLAPFDIERLGSAELSSLLRRLGITTLGGFAALEGTDVLARFGSDGARLHQLVRGLDGRPLDVRARPRDLAIETRLEPPAVDVDTTAFVAKNLAERLCGRLAAEGLACSFLGIEVETSTGNRLERRWAHDGAWTPALVAERLRWQLEAWLVGPGLAGGGDGTNEEVGIARVRLVPTDVVADTGRQLELWGRPRADDERVARAFARVQGLLGPEEVVRPLLVGGREPAERVRFVPFGDPAPARPDDAALPWPGQLPSPNPTVVPREPYPAEVLDRDGRHVGVDGRGTPSGVPASVAVGGRPPSLVVAWAGPWPVDEQWWDTAAHRRRARFQVVTADGGGYLLAIDRGRWVVEGSYD
jgi:protein ImuB